MTIVCFASLFSSLLLPLIASGPVTPGQSHSLTTGLLPPTTKTTSEFDQNTQPITSSVSMSTRKPGAISATTHSKVSVKRNNRRNGVRNEQAFYSHTISNNQRLNTKCNGPSNAQHLRKARRDIDLNAHHTSDQPVLAEGSTTQHTSLYKTSKASTKTPSISTTKRQKPSPIKPDNNAKSSQEANHGKAVAWIIGGALVLMMVGFLGIYVKKRKLYKQKITTSDWAGPSPFLEGGDGSNGQVKLRSSNQISLSSFLPQRLSRRLSLLQETEEELEEIKVNSTFGREEAGGDVQANNGAAVVVPEEKSTGDAPTTVETSVTSSQTTYPLSMNSHSTSAASDVTNLRHDESANSPTLPDAADTNLPPLMDDDLRQP
ncbi:hypothetical protein LDENG_00026020 [Lucifuga dentata]|nr:hypothetical protein LDENG_00026020 [Lucifuga dentata]